MTRIPRALGLSEEHVRTLLEATRRAPSIHNTQPWRVRLTEPVIELYADPLRGLRITDPRGVELRLSCGAALFNLRTTLRGFGIRPVVTVLPDPQRPHLLAAIRHGGRKVPTPELERLRRAIPLRRTNRRPFSNTPVATPDQHALRRAAHEEGAWLHLVHDQAQRTQLSRLAARAHDIQMSDPAFRAELAAWTGTGDDRPDGVPARAGGPLPAPQDVWVLRDFTDGDGPVRAAGKDFEAEPLIAVLSSHTSGPEAELQAGQAMQRVLLTATVSGLAVSFLSQLVEVASIREQVRRLIDGTHQPQVVLRIGHGWPVAATPRRPIEELVLPEHARSAPAGGPRPGDRSGR
ncbi:Acg family FMN-binding oxidoreductase [Pseudonocardia hispaniensis]|uniref:Acg family FMN-binding oxidoreductase n=1 Tax=Pseudonocardia hispaniensis TaxID=904933 RepID=A0ABW1J2G1_9PSEU